MSTTTKKLFPIKNRSPRTRSEIKKAREDSLWTRSKFDSLVRDALSARIHIWRTTRGEPSKLSDEEYEEKRLALVSFARIKKEDLPSYCKIPVRSSCGCLAEYASNDCYGWCSPEGRRSSACKNDRNYGPVFGSCFYQEQLSTMFGR